jgi:hypothetical protein
VNAEGTRHPITILRSISAESIPEGGDQLHLFAFLFFMCYSIAMIVVRDLCGCR